MGMEHRACQPETPATTARVYYFPEFAAGGGPPPNGPVRSPHTFLADTAAGVALVYLDDENLWAVMSSNGDTYAEATNPGDQPRRPRRLAQRLRGHTRRDARGRRAVASPSPANRLPDRGRLAHRSRVRATVQSLYHPLMRGLAILASALLAAPIVLVGTACGSSPAGFDQFHAKSDAIDACQDSVTKMLKDPDSARFDGWTASPAAGSPPAGLVYNPSAGDEYYTASGMVNAKNGFGGYNGDEPYSCDAVVTTGTVRAQARSGNQAAVTPPAEHLAYRGDTPLRGGTLLGSGAFAGDERDAARWDDDCR